MSADVIRRSLARYLRPLVGAATLLMAAGLFLMTDVVVRGKQEREVSFNDRLFYQRAIEEVYQRHRIWPTENSDSKPDLKDALSQNLIREKVEDYLRKSAALERFWQRPITGEQLQAEVDRMTANTKQPEVLRELWAALDNDPKVIAECLARPALVERLIRNWYSNDQRFHGGLRERAEAELSGVQTPDGLRALSGQFLEQEWKRDRTAGNNAADRNARLAASSSLTPDEWNARVHDLARAFKPTNEQSDLTRELRADAISSRGLRGGTILDEVPVGKLSALSEGEDGFSVVTVTAKAADRIKVAGIVWRKETFEAWWSRSRSEVAMDLTTPDYQYKLTQSALNAATDGWTPMSSVAPNGRYNHTAVWTGSEMIVWGGLEIPLTCCSNNLPVNTGGRYTPATDSWHFTTTTNAPTPRYSHTAVWTGTEMVIWGGQDFNSRFNTGGRYNPLTDTWTGVNTAGAPSARTLHTVVWTGTEMIVWGGQDSSSCCNNPFNTGGRYNPTSDSWTGTNFLTAPPARSSQTAVWTGTEMIIWGGQDTSGNRFNTGGRYNPSSNTWAGVSTMGAPSARVAHTAVWTGDEMIIWGGGFSGCCGSGNNTGGRYNPATDSWTATTTVSAPDGRTNHTAVWTGSVMIIWGGSTNSSGNTGGRYTPETDSWTATNTISAPGARSLHTAVWTGSEMIVWGGNNTSFGFSNSGGRYNPATNTWLPTSTGVAPSGRELHTAVWTGSEMIIWGGYGPTTNFGSPIIGPLNAGNRYLPATDVWTPIQTINAPVARYNHTAVWTGSLMIIWGGYDGTNVLASGGRYNPVTNSWDFTNIIIPPSPPSPRTLHTAVWTGSEMIVWGGTDGFNYFNTGGRYHVASNTWAPTSTTDVPAARSNHTAVWAGNEMIVWGGFNSALGHLNSGGRYDALAKIWTPISTTGAPTSRINHTAIWSGSEMIVWGGFDGGNHLNTGGRYLAGADSWTPVTTSGAPSARYFHSAVFTGSEMIVWGGTDGSGYFNTGARYNISAGDWTPTTTQGAPSERMRHTAIWTGNEMIVWGGFDGTSYPSTGGRYTTGVAGQCSFMLSPTSFTLSANSAVAEIDVTATNGCIWSATTTVNWITIQTGAGSGDGTVTFQVAANPGSVRNGKITIADMQVTVSQTGTPVTQTRAGIFRSGFFWLLDVDGDTQLSSPPDRAFAFGGVPGDLPITGDWNGDGHSKVGIYRPSNALFILDYDGNGEFTGADKVYNLGLGTVAGDVPVVGDWNGDGTDKVGLFRQGFFWILDYNGNGVFNQGLDKTYAFGGVSGDVPVVGDWDGSGTSKIGLFRAGFFWILDVNGDGALNNVNQMDGDQAFAYGGVSGDVPVVGDWNGDGRDKVGVFRSGFFWVLDANGNRQFDGTGAGQDYAFAFGGIAGDKPVVGKW